MAKVKVTEIDEVAPEILATAIVDLSSGVKKLLDGPLRRDTLILLIQHSCPSTRRPNRITVDEVLHAIEHLGNRWVKKPRTKG